MVIVNPNLPGLERAAKALEPLLARVVFVGGTLTGVLVTDPGAPVVRATEDVDAITQIAGPAGYAWVIQAMANLGFAPDHAEGAPACRWKKGDIRVDLMGSQDSVFGETNPWYEVGLTTSVPYLLPGGLGIRILAGPVWLLTKWSAHLARSHPDMIGSRDLEDILAVLDGRPNLRAEIQGMPDEVRHGLKRMAATLLESESFMDHCLQGLGERQEGVHRLLLAMVGL